LKADIQTLRKLVGELEQAFEAEKNTPNGQSGMSRGPNAMVIRSPIQGA
jgi:hypothetical protein